MFYAISLFIYYQNIGLVFSIQDVIDGITKNKLSFTKESCTCITIQECRRALFDWLSLAQMYNVWVFNTHVFLSVKKNQAFVFYLEDIISYQTL